MSGERGHDRTFHAACVLVLGFGLPESESFSLLTEWNQSCSPPWTTKELEHKIQDAAKQPGERNYLRNALPEQWNKISIPRYRESPPHQNETASAKSPLKIQTLEDASREYLSRVKQGQQNSLMKTGLEELDAAIGGGYEQGEMIILAARPSHGKSAVALQMVHAANSSGHPAIVISEEMSAISLGKRTAQFASEIPVEDWFSRHNSVENDITAHFRRRSPCYVVESCGSADRAVEEIEKAIEERNVKLAVVDYAQLLRNEGRNRYEQITNTSVALKSVANRHQISVLVLCQLSRGIESRKTFTPVMSDLKETGQFEQDADVILFLVWPHRINPNSDPHEYMFFVSKNRNREIVQHAIEMQFLPSRQMIVPQAEKFTYENVWPENYE